MHHLVITRPPKFGAQTDKSKANSFKIQDFSISSTSSGCWCFSLSWCDHSGGSACQIGQQLPFPTTGPPPMWRSPSATLARRSRWASAFGARAWCGSEVPFLGPFAGGLVVSDWTPESCVTHCALQEGVAKSVCEETRPTPPWRLPFMWSIVEEDEGSLRAPIGYIYVYIYSVPTK